MRSSWQRTLPYSRPVFLFKRVRCPTVIPLPQLKSRQSPSATWTIRLSIPPVRNECSTAAYHDSLFLPPSSLPPLPSWSVLARPSWQSSAAPQASRACSLASLFARVYVLYLTHRPRQCHELLMSHITTADSPPNMKFAFPRYVVDPPLLLP